MKHYGITPSGELLGKDTNKPIGVFNKEQIDSTTVTIKTLTPTFIYPLLEKYNELIKEKDKNKNKDNSDNNKK